MIVFGASLAAVSISTNWRRAPFPTSEHELVAKVRENPSIQAMLPSIDRVGFQRPPSTRRERLHPPSGLLPECSTGNWGLVKPVLGTDTCSLDVFTQSQARYPLCRT